MEIEPFKNSHSANFLNSAKLEGWITDRREIEFLLRVYPEGCLVFLCEGQAAGFITSIRYARSAWIGNLLVRPEYRNKGIGRALIERVLQTLDISGCDTVWLTASAEGAHLYKTLGFIQIDSVQRWKGLTSLRRQAESLACSKIFTAIDSIGWGDDRLPVYELIRESSVVLSTTDGFLACTSFGEFQQIGPWGAFSREVAADFLDAAIGHDAAAITTFLDVPAKNRAAGELLRLKGFSISGATLLMYRGKSPEYRAEYVYALASMGSYG